MWKAGLFSEESLELLLQSVNVQGRYVLRRSLLHEWFGINYALNLYSRFENINSNYKSCLSCPHEAIFRLIVINVIPIWGHCINNNYQQCGVSRKWIMTLNGKHQQRFVQWHKATYNNNHLLQLRKTTRHVNSSPISQSVFFCLSISEAREWTRGRGLHKLAVVTSILVRATC